MTGTPFSFRGGAEQAQVARNSSLVVELIFGAVDYRRLHFPGIGFLSVALLVLGPNSLGPGHIENQSRAETRDSD